MDDEKRAKNKVKIEDLSKDFNVSDAEMKLVKGGPNRREHDHIGSFNLTAGLSTDELKR